ncbi:hypothetical protein C8R47DRAFT_1049878 [Mycena vitilis]|nr:hypothetical protein C8R47DRAFT_1049878 [Mycena vitilis]
MTLHETSLVPRGILETNDPPLESQLPFLRDFLTRGRARISILENEMGLGVLQTSLDNLAEERDQLSVEIRKHEGALSPLRRTPTEILSHIFIFTLPPHRLDKDPAPWTVSAVCARWRTAVISNPCFWTRIDLDYYSRVFTNIFRLEIQLQRSKELPLNVRFSTLDNAFFTSEDAQKLRLLCEHACRWQTVDISGPEELFDGLEVHIQDQLPLLSELTIEMLYESNEVPSLTKFENAPLLQRVVVNKGLWTYPVEMELPWSQLVHYVGSNTWDGHLDALSIATNLVDCSLAILEKSEIPETPILLPHLLRLYLTEASFLDCLDAPAILELYCEYDAAVLPFLRRQDCKLKKLVMWESTPPGDTELTRIVKAVPTITTLALDLSLSTQFALDFSHPSMAPALEHFVTVVSEDVQDDLTKAIKSRWRGGRLKSVRMEKSISTYTLDRMKVLQAQGMGFLVAEHLLWDALPPELWIEGQM